MSGKHKIVGEAMEIDEVMELIELRSQFYPRTIHPPSQRLETLEKKFERMALGDMLVHAIKSEREKSAALLAHIELECFCHILHPDIGGKCGHCEFLAKYRGAK